MPRYEVKIPGQGTFEVESPEPLTDQQAYAAALQQIKAGKVEKPASGILGALGKGFESSVSAARAGIKGLIAPEEAAEEAKARGEDIAKRYAEQVSLEKVKKAYEERGLLPAAGEAISQIPYAIAEQAPNIAATLAGGRLGAMAGAPFGPAGVIGGALVGAATPSLFQQAGGNIQRQAEEAIARGETPEISRLAAYGTGAVQAGLDVAGTLIPLGRALAGKALGPTVERALARGIEEGNEKLAKEVLAKSIVKGTAVGTLAEIPTEVTQQMLERAQAGLPLLSEEAFKEYGETAYQATLLGPIGAVGRVVDRSQARDIVEQRALSKQARERQAERAKLAEQEAQQEQFKQTDEYALKFVTDHDALQKEYDDNAAVLKKKLPPGSSFADRQTFDDLKKRQKELKEQLQSQAAEYNKLLPKVQGLRDAEAQQKAQLAAQQEQAALAEQQARMREEQLAGPMQQQVIPGMEPPTLREPTEEATPEQRRALSLGLTQQRQEIEKLLEDNQQAQSDAVEKGDFDLRRRLAGQRTALQSELNYLNTQLKKAGVYTDEIAKAQKLQAQLDKARQDLKNMSGPGFDPAAADKLDAKIQKLEEELSQYGGVQQALDLGKAEPLKGLPPQAARADYGARVYKPGAADIEAQEAALREEEARAEEARLAEERRAQKVAPEEVALRRIGEREPVTIGEKDIYGPTADRIVESIIERQQPTFAGQVVAGEGIQIVDRGDALRAQLAYARVTNNKTRIEELKKRLADLDESETETPGSAVELGAQAKRVGVEGRETPETMAANRVTRLSQSQLVAYDRLSGFINSVREREVPSDEGRVNTLKEAAYRLRDTVVGLALNEADARLAQVGRPGLTTDQQLQLVAALERPLNELIQRGALALMPPVAQSAQMRGTRIVMGAKESQAGKRLFGSFPAASNTIRAQIRSVIDKAIGARAPKEKGKPVKAEGLRVQFAATAKERTEEQLFKEAYAKATDAEARELERIQKRLPYVDNQFVRSAIMDSVRDKANGKVLTLDDKSQQALTALDRAVQDEGAQAELFPGETAKGITRTTPGKFQRFLDSAEVARLRTKQTEYNKQAAYLAKMAAGIEARIERERKAADDYVNSLTAGKAKTPAEAAERALQTAVDKNAEAVRIADAINKRRMEERVRIAAMIVELERGKTVAQKKVDELAELGEYLSNQMLIKPTDKKIEAAAKDLDKQLKKAVKDYQAVIAATDKAKALQTKILEAHANDTIDNSLIRAGAKAQERIDKARTELSAARQAEGEARRAVEAVQKAQVTETEEQRRQRALLYPSEGVRRIVVARDTTVPEVVSQLKKQRGIIAKHEEDYEVARQSKDESGMQKASAAIQTSYERLYAILDNAPVRQYEVATEAEAKAFEQYETAERRLADAELKASFAEKGLAEPKTPARRKLGPVAKVQSAAPTTMRTGTEESRAGLTTRGQPVGSRITTVEATEAELERLNKIVQRSALGDIAAKRAELNQINDQLKFIAANPKGTTRTGKPKLSDKQEAAKKAAEARKRELQAELTKLVEEQKTAVKQVQESRAAGKALRAETRKLARTEAEETGEVSEERKLLRGVEVESPDLTPTQVNSIRNNDVVAALEDIANDKTASELNRAVARRLSTLLEGTRIEIVDGLTDDKGNGVSGAATSKLIQLDAKYGLSQEVLLHEAVHAATERVIQADETKLTREQLIAKRELQALFAAIQNDPGITSKNAKSSLSEFVAEALSNSNLQEQLRGKKWRLSDAWKGIKSIILRLLGIKNPETMLGATLAAVDNLMIPSSQRALMEAPVTSRNLAQKDIAALDDGSNSMKEFASQFAQYIKQKDRTPEDVNRIGMEFLDSMAGAPFDYVAEADPNKLDYKSDTVMSDGKVFDPENPLHLVEATPTTFVALKAQQDGNLRSTEARAINRKRKEDLRGLIDLLRTNGSYTWPEQALVAKAAARYAVLSSSDGKLRLAEISDNNRHPIAVVSKEAANAVIEELRKGKSLKAAFLDGLQRNADANVQRNSTKQGWQKFDQVVGDVKQLESLYTDKEIDEAFGKTGYDGSEFADNNALITQLIRDGWLPDRRNITRLEQAAVSLNSACAGTSWCTGAGVSTARSQIENGDFYVYYKNGRPEVAIRMNGKDDIGEIRGNTPQQFLTPEQQEIARSFLLQERFKGADKFLDELTRKETMLRLLKGNTRVGDSRIFKGVESDRSIDRMFEFRTLDGYASERPAPTKAIRQQVLDLKAQLVAKDEAQGYYFTRGFGVEWDGKAKEFKVRNRGGDKTPNLPSISQLKAVDELLVFEYKWADKNLVLSLPALTEARRLSIFEDASFPALNQVDDVTLFKDGLKVTFSDTAEINKLEGYSGNVANPVNKIRVVGAKQINAASSFNGVIETAPFVRVVPDRDGNKFDIKTPARIADAPPPEELVDVPERPRYAPINPALQGVMGVVDQVVAKQKPISDRVRAASGGFLGAETQLVDRFAGFEKLAKYMPKYQGAQMLYYLRMYDQKMNYTSQSAGNGALQLVPYKRPDGETEYIIESVDGANLRNVVLILRDAKNLVGDVDATSRLFTFYLAAKRAERVGFDKLDISGQVTEAQLRDVVRQVESVKGLKEIFESARDEYNQYNADQIRFMVQAGVMNQEEANRLLKAKDYIPWYRSRNGVVEMMIGGETPFKVGNIKDTPHLEQLVGGSEPILDFMVSSVQNTNMLVDMALNNIAKRNAIIELADMGAAIITPKPTSGRDVVKFKYHGEDRYAILQTEQIKIGDKVIDTGVPADLLVKGMEGIPLQVSGVMRLMSIPTMILRKSVTLNPAQMFRQLFRDTTQAYLAAGSDAAPVLGALKEIGSGTRGVLEKRGITGGQVFTGTAEDISKIMREIAKGGVNATRLLAGLEASAAEVDAATRRSQYNSYLKQGMSQMEATLLALESMNFNKRGASPSVHAANALYPFFNAQIQGINVLYKAMFGQLSPSDRARIKEKLITRATMMIAVTLAYAHMMQDDEAYKNATPEQKYFNWFVRVPGVEEPVRIPIPFEPGYIFKALPEAMYNRLVAQTTTAADEAKGAMAAILRNIIPGASNWFVPQALATPVQIGANYSFYQGRSILSKREQELLPEQQYRDNTTELAKLFGGATGISPIMFEEAVRGYFAGLGLATLQIASLPITPKEGPEKATKRLSQMPVVGALFQPNDAGWIINNTYDTLDEARKTQRTVTELINRGEIAQARALMEERKSDYVRAELEGYYRQEMGQLTQLEAAIRASSKTPDEKREFLDRVRQYKIKLAAMVRDASDKTKLQADLS